MYICMCILLLRARTLVMILVICIRKSSCRFSNSHARLGDGQETSHLSLERSGMEYRVRISYVASAYSAVHTHSANSRTMLPFYLISLIFQFGIFVFIFYPPQPDSLIADIIGKNDSKFSLGCHIGLLRLCFGGLHHRFKNSNPEICEKTHLIINFERRREGTCIRCSPSLSRVVSRCGDLQCSHHWYFRTSWIS